MKKSLLFFGILAMLLSACTINGLSINTQTIQGTGSVTSEPRTVSGFDAVVLKGIGNLEVVHGTSESLTVSADKNILPYITTEVVNGTLEIGTKENVNLNPSQTIEYKLTVKSLSAVILSGFGKINVDKLEGGTMSAKLTGSGDIQIGEVDGQAFALDLTGFGNVDLAKAATTTATLHLTGSGNINLPALTATELNLTISGFGDVTVSGTADDQVIYLTGSGNYKGGDLQTKTSKVTISGLGNATAWATETIDITITGSGNVEFYGSPTINTTLTGMGKVKSLGER